MDPRLCAVAKGRQNFQEKSTKCLCDTKEVEKYQKKKKKAIGHYSWEVIHALEFFLNEFHLHVHSEHINAFSDYVIYAALIICYTNLHFENLVYHWRKTINSFKPKQNQTFTTFICNYV